MTEKLLELKLELRQEINKAREHAASVAEKRRNEALAIFGLISLIIGVATFFSIDHIVSLGVRERIGDEVVNEMKTNAATIEKLKNNASESTGAIKMLKDQYRAELKTWKAQETRLQDLESKVDLELYECKNTGYINGWDAKMNFNFDNPSNTVIVGVYSVHDNHREDRRFKLRHCKIRKKPTRSHPTTADRPS